jgi:hypothetical protein
VGEDSPADFFEQENRLTTVDGTKRLWDSHTIA